MAVISKDLGPVTAYAAAVNRGYTGTRAEFEELMASYATVAEQAGESAESAEESAASAAQSAANASQSAQNAESSKYNALLYSNQANGYKNTANTAAQAAKDARDTAQVAQTAAEAAQEGAEAAVEGFDSAVTQAISDVNAAGTNQKELAKRQAEKSEAWAIGQINGEDVGISDPAYHNNAKYYAEQTAASSQQIIDDAAAEKAAAQIARQGAEAAKDDAIIAKTAAEEAQAAAEAAAEAAEGAIDVDDTLSVRGRPADAKVVRDEITLLSNGKMIISGNLSYGTFENNFPVADPRKFNAVMMTAEKYDRDITVTAKDGYNFLAYFYDANDNYVSKGARWESSRYVPKNTYFRLWVRQNPLDTSAVLDLKAVKYNIVFNTVQQDEIEKNTNDVELNTTNVALNGKGLSQIDTAFEWGTMNTTTGAVDVHSAYKWQVVMPHAVRYDRDVTIKCNPGYRYQVWWYDESDRYISRTGSFKTSAEEYTVSAGTYFRLFVTLDPPNNQTTVAPAVFTANIFTVTEIGETVNSILKMPLSTFPSYIVNTLSERAVGPLSKGYICISCDDGTEGLATYTIPMLISKGIPATFGLLDTSPVITNETYLATVIDAVNNHGCCVAQHGSAQWPTYSEKALTAYFDATKTLFTSKGISEIHGAICPGGAGTDTNTLVKAIAGGRFGAVFSGGLQDEVKYGSYNAVGPRTNMYAMARYSAIGFTQQTYQQAIDDAYDNHYILCPFWHDYSVVNDTAKQAIIDGMIDYAKTKGLTFITMADLPTII